MASIFTVSENDLYNFESFCDSKYEDANCQKYGFFKIKLDESCAGQCTTLNEFQTLFGKNGSEYVLQYATLQNPAVKNLYGTTAGRAHQNLQKQYMDLSLGDKTSFQVSSNCCLHELENGEEALLRHLLDSTIRKSVTVYNNHKDSLNTVRKRAASMRKAFEKRYSLRNIKSLEGRKVAFNAAIKWEKVPHSSSVRCICDSCALTFDKLDKSDNNGTLYCPGIEESKDNFVFITANFAMSHLCYSNMLSDLGSVFSGVSYPALYLGSLHSFFPLHVEDLSCWSFNFLLHGYPKFWIMIPPTSVSRLTDALQRRGNFGPGRWCRNLLHHKYFIPTVQFLKDESIPYELVIQYEGEGIVLLPNCAHAGWNLGTNLSEACNFGTSKWIPYGCVSPQCICTYRKSPVHADLSDLLAVHEPTLLEAYRDGKIYDAIKDQYFQKSTIIPKMDNIRKPSVMQERSATCVPSEPVPAPAPAATMGNLPMLQANKSRVQCPVCRVSWASVQKFNIKTHLMKHHRRLINEEAVRKFCLQYSISLQ